MSDPRFQEDCVRAGIPRPGENSYEYRLWQIGVMRGNIEGRDKSDTRNLDFNTDGLPSHTVKIQKNLIRK